MAILKVARLGHPALRRIADPVPPEDILSPEIQGLIGDLLDTVDEYDGAGLAAPQVHVSLRVVVLSLGGEGLRVWINPVLRTLTDDLHTSAEGCLSVPGLRGRVSRPAAVEVRALDHQGRPVHLELRGFPAVVAQHECDHLDGVIYVDKVEPGTLMFLEEFGRYGRDDEAEYDDDDDNDDLDLDDDLAPPLNLQTEES